MRQHGTNACFVWGPEPGSDLSKGCRCEPCRAAHTAYEKERRQRIAPAYVTAGRARAHVAELMAAGVGLKTIAKRSGVSHGALWKLVYGMPGRGPSKRVRPATESALLAVTPADRADGARVPAGPVHDDIATLVTRGWQKTAIARRLGQKVGGLQLDGATVTAKHARTIHALLDEPVPAKNTRWGAREVAQPEPEPDLRPDPQLPDLSPIDEPWRQRAACRRPDTPTWMFYPSRGDFRTTKAALQVCAWCPVKAECLASALAEPEYLDAGIRGGLTERDRRTMREQARQAVAS